MRVRRSATFARLLEAHVSFLTDRDDAEGIRRLEEDLFDLTGLLGSFPDAGRELATSKRGSLRKLRLRRCPFVVWYVRQKDGVTLARIYHARQDRPSLDQTITR